MTITQTPETERLINEALQSGHYHSVEEVIRRALYALRVQEQASLAKPQACQDAAARIRELRKGVTVGGLPLKDLIHADHKYCWFHP